MKTTTPFSRTALVLVCAIIVLAPLTRGGVHLWARSLVQIVTLMAFLLLVLERLFNGKAGTLIVKSPLDRPIAAALLLAALSAGFSPHGSLAAEGFMMFLTYILIYYITLNSVRSRKEQRMVVYVVIASAILISMIGLLKSLDFNPFFWWNYPELKYPVYFMSGPYGNHNHMAGFLEMTIPMVLILFMTRERSREFICGMLCLVLFLLLIQGMTLSRGGWASTAGSLLFMLTILLLQKGFRRKKMLVGITGIVVVTGVILLASTPVVDRLATLTQESSDESMGSRMVCWQGTLLLVLDHYILGTGAGTYADAYPGYQPAGLNVLFNHAHNDYLEIIAESGVWIVPIVIWMLFLFYRNCHEKMKSPSRQTRGVTLGVMTAVFAILVHSLGDFNLQIPANAALFAVLCALP